MALGPCDGAKGHFVAILEEGAGLSAGKRYGARTALADLEQAAECTFFRTRQRARADQVARLEC